PGVSILVVLDLPPPQLGGLCLLLGSLVSILVVLDLPPPPPDCLRPGLRMSSFNPCCSGSPSSAPGNVVPERRVRAVSILFVMDLPPPPCASPVQGPEPSSRVSILVVLDLPPPRCMSTATR